MVLGETCKMAATSADRRKVAALGAGRGDWLCIGTSLDALGFRGRVTAPGPDLFSWIWRSARASTGHCSLFLACRLVGQFGRLRECNRRVGGQISGPAP